MVGEASLSRADSKGIANDYALFGNNDESSSLLPMLDAHNQVAPEAAYIETETVDVSPLNDIPTNTSLRTTISFLNWMFRASSRPY